MKTAHRVAAHAKRQMHSAWESEPPDFPGDAVDQDAYTDLVRKGARGICGLQMFMFTTGLVAGLTPFGYDRRYCYEHAHEARAVLVAWDGVGHPPGPWIKCKGYGIDLLNPELKA